MTKKEAAAAINETAAYIERNGGVRNPLYEEARSLPLCVFDVMTEHGPASVSLIPPAGRSGAPWLALQYSHLALALEAMRDGRLSRDINPLSGKYNCHILDCGRTAQEVAGAFKQHLAMAGFRETQPANWMPVDYTCGCGLYVHPSRRNPEAIHIEGCEYQQPAELIVEAPAATKNGKD